MFRIKPYLRAPPWSAGTCHRFGTAILTKYNALYQSGDKSPHSKEGTRHSRTPNFSQNTSEQRLNGGISVFT